MKGSSIVGGNPYIPHMSQVIYIVAGGDAEMRSPEEDKGKKKEDKPIVPLSNPIALYGELNPPLEMMEIN